MCVDVMVAQVVVSVGGHAVVLHSAVHHQVLLEEPVGSVDCADCVDTGNVGGARWS